MKNPTSTYRYALENKRSRKWQSAMRINLIKKLQDLNVKVNTPHEMAVGDLRKLVNCHMKTIMASKKYVSKEKMETAAGHDLTKEDVSSRVNDLNWDVEVAVAVKPSVNVERERREARRAERMRVIQAMNESEASGNHEKFEKLERELAGI